jgi:(p)ppGpp synthase/HD superfamily hydrolase
MIDADYTRVQLDVIQRALVKAAVAHTGQTRASGSPYIHHSLTVADILVDLGMDHETVAAAILHDVVEDTSATLEEIALEFGAEVAGAVDAMSKRKGEAYETYLHRVTTNSMASVVKFYDMEHNSDISRLITVREKDLKRVEKYKKYMLLLEKYL